jgi:hypothetical protein
MSYNKLHQELKMYGMTQEDIREQYMRSLTARISGQEMVVMGILSDCQEMLEFGYDKDDIRKHLNVAKYILSEVLESKNHEVV